MQVQHSRELGLTEEHDVDLLTVADVLHMLLLLVLVETTHVHAQELD